MKKIIIYLAFIILFSYSAMSIELNLSQTTYGPENIFQGTIKIPAGTYPAGTPITLTTSGDTKSLELYTLVDCDLTDCSSVSATYKTTGATETSLHEPSILTGLKIRKNSVIQDSYFDISKYNDNLPAQPIIDIGNDNDPEWRYKGYPLDFPSGAFSNIVISLPNNLEETKTVITENCQRFTLPKSMRYKVKTYAKALPSAGTLDIFIPEIASEEQTGSCSQPTSSWGEVECNIELTNPLEQGTYHFCLTGNNNILATNATALNPRGYIACSTGSCNPVDKNYIMNFTAAEYVTTLNSQITFTTSNTKKDQFNIYYPLDDLINNYLETCPIQNNYCILPINISSQNENQVKVYNLNYRETTEIGEVLLKNGFLSSVTQQGTSTQIILNSPLTIQLSEFNFNTPEDIDDYELTINFLEQTDSDDYEVISGPRAVITASPAVADILETISFSALNSEGNGTLTYQWDFDDGANSTLTSVSHSYSRAGTYVVRLTVTDSNDISSTTLKAISIGATASTPATNTEQALNLVDEAEIYYNSASPKIKSLYSSLNLVNKIKNAKTTLVTTSVTSAEVDEILNSIPKTLVISDSYEITPFLTTPDLETLLPLQESAIKETARTLNERIVQKIEADSISITYLSQQKEDFILIKKIINVPQNIQNAVIMDLIPSSLAPSSSSINFISPSTADITNLNAYQSIRFSLSSLETSKVNEILYKISSQNLNEISKIKTLVLSEDLSTSLIPINCGNGICNPGEDYITCPEDCRCGNGRCDLDETELTCPEDCKKTSIMFFISILVILGVIAALIFVIYKNPQLKEKLKLDEIMANFKHKKQPFTSEEDLTRVLNFIKASKEEDHTEKQISLSLLKKGWTKTQVKHAFKKLKNDR